MGRGRERKERRRGRCLRGRHCPEEIEPGGGEAGVGRWRDSAVTGRFTEYLCSVQRAARTRALKLRRVVAARGKRFGA